MQDLKITLRHGDLIQTKCSAIFMKHIERTMSAPEQALIAAVEGKLQTLLAENEKKDHSIVTTERLLACPVVYVVNFHEQDLPFSYRSVDCYARTIVRVAASGNIGAIAEPMSVATAIHGPGAGLDASEAMETLLVGFASEMRRIPQPACLGEVILVENHRDIFERLQERLKYLASKHIVRFDGERCFINPESDQSSEVERVNRLALNHLFIAMPFAKEFNNAYYFGIKQPVEQRGRKCERVDQDAFTGDIVERVKRRVSSCELVIADITGNNPNVFYELGYAEGRGKPAILISQEQETPFDLKTRRQIRYKPEDILSLTEALGAQLDGLLNPHSGR